MKTQIKNLVFALIAVAALATNANAQEQTTAALQTGPAVVGPQAVIAPPYLPPVQQNQYYFGMQVQLIQGWGGPTLRVVSVTWGSPAQRAGLEIGDEIRTVNGRGFGYAQNSYDAVRLLNQFVGNYGGVVPTAAAPATAVSGIYGPWASPIANMIVRNVRNGQDVSLIVRPTFNGGLGGPAPAASAL